MEEEESACPNDRDHDHYKVTDADERSAEERAIDDWLPEVPVTSSRTGKWWYSAFHNITAIVGAGVLGLPYAMSQMGWGPGTTFLVVSWIVSLCSLWQMVEMHEIVPGKRFDRYQELAQYAFGETVGLWFIWPQQLISLIGIDIVYMITGGHCLKKFHDLVCEDCKDIKLTYFIIIFASVHFVLCLMTSFKSITGISIAAAIMSLSYSTITWGASVHKGVQPNVQYSYKSNTTIGTVFGFFSALGSVVFAYGSQGIVLEIQATMPSTAEKPSKGPMFRGVIAAYIAVALCYLPVALIGYGMFGNQVDENILMTLERPKWLIAMANMFVVVHLMGAYQLYSMPVFDLLEYLLVKKLKLRETWYLRLLLRHSFVAFTMFTAISFPFFGEILGLIGGFCFAPMGYAVPSIVWLCIRKPMRFSLSWFASLVCITFGIVLMVVASAGGLRQIILHAKHYDFYS